MEIASTDIKHDVAMFTGDSILRRVLENMVKNALEASKAGGPSGSCAAKRGSTWSSGLTIPGKWRRQSRDKFFKDRFRLRARAGAWELTA
jgi:hypothetical protein